MKKNLYKSLSIPVVLALLLCALCPLISHADSYVEWKLSEDGNTLTDGTNTYNRYYMPLGVFVDAKTEYVYENTVLDGVNLSSVQPNGDIVWSDHYPNLYVYANAAGKQSLDSFLKNDTGIYRIADGEGNEAALDAATVQVLEALHKDGVTMDVGDLMYAPANSLYLYDKTDTFYKEYGAIYTIGGQFYYLGYEDLPNNHFDASGRFSYRSGEVTLYPVDRATNAVLNSALADLEYRSYEIIWESEEDLFAYEDDFFMPAYIFWGFILPAVFLALGIILPRISRKKKTPLWNALIPVSGAWIAFAAILLAIVI